MEKSNERVALRNHELGKVGSGLFFKPTRASCGLKLSANRVRVLGDEIKQQVLERGWFARTLVGCNGLQLHGPYPPRHQPFVEFVARCDLGDPRACQDRGDGLGAELGRMRDAAGHGSC